MGKALGTAAAQHQPDAWPALPGISRRSVCGRRRNTGHDQQHPDRQAHQPAHRQSGRRKWCVHAVPLTRGMDAPV
jgi:hypothetical protein